MEATGYTQWFERYQVLSSLDRGTVADDIIVTMSISAKFSYEDLQLIPFDRNRYEIVDGELFVTAAPIPLHQVIVGNTYGDRKSTRLNSSPATSRMPSSA